VSRVPRVHAVTDDRVVALPDFLTRARALAQGPDVAIHLRAARLSARNLLALADQLRAITRDSGTRLFVHDRVDLALLSAADGVHLPGSGLPVRPVRAYLGPGWLVGRSTHGAGEARAAIREGADYAFLGSIWPTASHPDRVPLGSDAITAARPGPVIAIGGVTAARSAEARARGASGVAAITALWDAPDPAAAVRALLLSFKR
jgi:thiamine-phosphate pyrophosphorylase